MLVGWRGFQHLTLQLDDVTGFLTSTPMAPGQSIELHILTDVSISRGYIITSVIVRGNGDIRGLLPCVVEEEV